MESYVLVESRDPFDGADPRRLYGLAGNLAGHADVTVFLVQNAVLAARRGSAAQPALEALATKANVVADDFSLRQRAIGDGDLAAGVTVAGVDGLVDVLLDGAAKAMWL